MSSDSNRTGNFLAPDNTSAAGGRNEPTSRVRKRMSLDRPMVVAHRGYSLAAPENTIPAFRLGLLAQADLVELDYHHTSDDIPVVIHDPTVKRTTDAEARWNQGSIPVASKTMDELRELDAGAWFDRLFSGTGLSTLEEALDFIQPEAIPLIEHKKGKPEALIGLLERKRMLAEVVVQSFDWSFVVQCHALAPGLVLGALGPPPRPDGGPYPEDERWLNTGFLEKIEGSGAMAAVWNRQVTNEAVAEARERGLRVWVYVINDLNTATNLLEMGVDGIISDNPALAWKAVALYNGRRRAQ